MSLTYTVNTDVTGEPVEVSELKEHLRVTHDEEDKLIEDIGKAAREQVEMFTRRQLMKATYDYTVETFPAGDDWLEIPKPPLQSLTATYIDVNGTSQTLTSTLYTVDTASEPGRFFLAKDQSWPDLEGAPNVQEVTLVCVTGYSSSATLSVQRAAVPLRAKQAIKILATQDYEHRGGSIEDSPAARAKLWGLRVPDME